MKLYTHRDVRGILGMADQTIRDWVSKGVFSPQHTVGVGKGARMALTDDEVIALAVAKMLRKWGLGLEDTREAVALIQHRRDDLLADRDFVRITYRDEKSREKTRTTIWVHSLMDLPDPNEHVALEHAPLLDLVKGVRKQLAELEATLGAEAS